MPENFTWFSPKHRYDPNAMVHSMYRGVAPGGRVVTSLIKPDVAGSHMETSRTYEEGLPPGQGGFIGHIIIGGMETTLDEMEELMEAKREKKWVPRKSGKDIADMCRHLMEIRNVKIRYYRKNPSEAPKFQPKKNVLLLPVGVKWQDTPIPGLQVTAKV